MHPNKSIKHACVFPLNSTEIEKQLTERLPAKPEWLRIAEAVRFYGIGRSSLYELIADGRIKSVVLKKRGNIRGIRLLSSFSLDGLLEALATGGDAK